MLPAIPKRRRSPIKKLILSAKPRSTRLDVYNNNAIEAILLLPYLVTNHPDKGKAIMDPAGSANNTTPSKASERFRCCCMLGIRDAHVAKQSPCRKNKHPTANRNDLFKF
jgi:hypothetical protein